MATNYEQKGYVIDYTNPGADIASGDVVVIGSTMGVALTDILAGETGAVQISNVFNLPKADAADISQGDPVYWIAADGNFHAAPGTPAAGDVANCCVAMESKGASSGDTIAVKLNVGIGDVTP